MNLLHVADVQISFTQGLPPRVSALVSPDLTRTVWSGRSRSSGPGPLVPVLWSRSSGPGHSGPGPLVPVGPGPLVRSSGPGRSRSSGPGRSRSSGPGRSRSSGPVGPGPPVSVRGGAAALGPPVRPVSQFPVNWPACTPCQAVPLPGLARRSSRAPPVELSPGELVLTETGPALPAQRRRHGDDVQWGDGDGDGDGDEDGDEDEDGDGDGDGDEDGDGDDNLKGTSHETLMETKKETNLRRR